MICPECSGARRVRKRFLIFFERWKRCPTCLGSGEYPPPVADRVGYRPARWRDDDDGDTWAARGYGAGAIASRLQESREQEAPPRDDAFEVGTGGRSGGAGATASWGDAASDNAPVIVDPFAGDASAVSGVAGGAIAAEAVDA